GAGPGPALMLNGHVDAVGVAGMQDPFSGAIRDGKLFARGAYDMKGSIAACLGAVKALVDAGASFRGEVLLAAVADEEDASIGTADLLTKYRVDAAIVTEPTHLDICLAHKGFVWIEVETLRRARSRRSRRSSTISPLATRPSAPPAGACWRVNPSKYPRMLESYRWYDGLASASWAGRRRSAVRRRGWIRRCSRLPGSRP